MKNRNKQRENRRKYKDLKANELKYNASGIKDPTAYRAIINTEKYKAGRNG